MRRNNYSCTIKSPTGAVVSFWGPVSGGQVYRSEGWRRGMLGYPLPGVVWPGSRRTTLGRFLEGVSPAILFGK